MNGIYFTCEGYEREVDERVCSSKLLGAPTIPEGFLSREENALYDEEFFVMQLNLGDIDGTAWGLPRSGYLYFFVDVSDMTPRVLYTEDEPGEIISDINDAFLGEYGKTNPHYLTFLGEGGEGCFVLGPVNPDLGLEAEINTDEYVTLLEIDGLALPEDADILRIGYGLPLGGHLMFLIKPEDLAKRDFSRVILLETES